MAKLYLTSTRLSALPRLFPPTARPARILFIPTAANNHPTKWFVEADRKALSDMGYSLSEIDLARCTREELEKEMSSVEVIHVTGGNSFYLLEKIQESGFDALLPSFLERGGVYSGSSAGAVIAGPSIEPVLLFDDPKEASDLHDYIGLGLINKVILPHFGRPEDTQTYAQIIDSYCSHYTLQTLTDQQAIVVNGDSVEIIAVA